MMPVIHGNSNGPNKNENSSHVNNMTQQVTSVSSHQQSLSQHRSHIQNNSTDGTHLQQPHYAQLPNSSSRSVSGSNFPDKNAVYYTNLHYSSKETPGTNSMPVVSESRTELKTNLPSDSKWNTSAPAVYGPPMQTPVSHMQNYSLQGSETHSSASQNSSVQSQPLLGFNNSVSNSFGDTRSQTLSQAVGGMNTTPVIPPSNKNRHYQSGPQQEQNINKFASSNATHGAKNLPDTKTTNYGDPGSTTNYSDSRMPVNYSSPRLASNFSSSRSTESYSDPRLVTNPTDSRAPNNPYDSRLTANSSVPRLSTTSSDPRLGTNSTIASSSSDPRLATNSNVSDPRIATNYSDPRIATNYSDPRIATNYGDPRLATNYGDPRPQASHSSSATNSFPPTSYQQSLPPNHYPPSSRAAPYSSSSAQPPPVSSSNRLIQYPYPNQPTQKNLGQDLNSDMTHLVRGVEAMNTSYGSSNHLSGASVSQGFNKLWGMENVDLLQQRNVLPSHDFGQPETLNRDNFGLSVNCSPDVLRCTLSKIPNSSSLLQKSRLPLGILIHPFKDLTSLSVVQGSTIVRCRVCRTYINPFVAFIDSKRWKCNLCFRVNDIPDDFQFDPITKNYGDPSRRPEIKCATIEYIAPGEYILRPPQPAVYLFLLDTSRFAVESGYLQLFADILLRELDNLPGDSRTQVGFITFCSSVHFYNLNECLSQPQELIVNDIEDIFLPCPDDLLVNLSESRELISDLLKQLPQKFANTYDEKSALGAALQAAYQLMAPTGGRVTVFQCCLPNIGPGMLFPREDPNQRAGKDVQNLNPATDFYKRLALDCSGQQIAIDIFLLNTQYSDLASLSGVSRFSGGCIYNFPLFNINNHLQCDGFENSFTRYLTRKIGFEAVMRVRCTRGLAIHSFHGNFFVRSTDLLSLPNINPDSGFGMQIVIEESLSDMQYVAFQAALLYTSSKAERRIRVHTLCLPLTSSLSDVLHYADAQCIVGLLAKMAVDRSLQSSLLDAREALINVAIDAYSAFKLTQNSGYSEGLLSPKNLAILPMYLLALLKFIAFRVGVSTRLDDRVFAMLEMKTLPLTQLLKRIYPDFYRIHNIEHEKLFDIDGSHVPLPPRMHLSSEKLDSRGVFLLDAGTNIFICFGQNVPSALCSALLGVPDVQHIAEETYGVPKLDNAASENLGMFLNYLQSEKPFNANIQVMRSNSRNYAKFLEYFIEDHTESSLSYYEFLQHIKSNVR